MGKQSRENSRSLVELLLYLDPLMSEVAGAAQRRCFTPGRVKNGIYRKGVFGQWLPCLIWKHLMGTVCCLSSRQEQVRAQLETRTMTRTMRKRPRLQWRSMRKTRTMMTTRKGRRCAVLLVAMLHLQDAAMGCREFICACAVASKLYLQGLRGAGMVQEEEVAGTAYLAGQVVSHSDPAHPHALPCVQDCLYMHNFALRNLQGL